MRLPEAGGRARDRRRRTHRPAITAKGGEMTDRPEDRPEERRRTGPLGDDAESGATRRDPPGETDANPTRQAPTGQPEQADREQASSRETERIPQRPAGETEDKETRVIRTPGSGPTQGEAGPYPRGYFEAAEEREDRLRDMYGGVDWLASFLGLVFAIVLGSVFSAVAGFVLGPFGITPDLSGGQIGASLITGLALLGVLIFLTFFFAGYVAGRLSRFDGGRNGAMVVVWMFIVGVILALAAAIFSGFLPTGMADGIANLLNRIFSTATNLAGAGVVGLVTAAAALLLALLGGSLGGRLGSRYHTEIDRAT